MTEELLIEIDIARQLLRLYRGSELFRQFSVSTARNGAGEQMDSECTPRGEHVIVEKIGDGFDPNTVFVGRQPTGEIYIKGMREKFPERDWILTRILWLEGVEPGLNRGGNVDSKKRYIYIHGTPDDVDIHMPGSRGCIRMRNRDVIELFDLVKTGTPVVIHE